VRAKLSPSAALVYFWRVVESKLELWSF